MATIDFSQVHSDAIEAMKTQLLIVLINRLGGKVEIPVAEIDDTGGFNVAMRLDDVARVFHFEAKGVRTPHDPKRKQ